MENKHKEQVKKKVGFLHIPRTGGTHLERLLNEMGPNKFINFFGVDMPENRIVIPETMKRGDQKHKQLLNNPNYKTCELFGGHFSHNIEECFDEEVEFFTILRNPIQRVTSMTKQFLTSKVYKGILMNGAEVIGDDVFWKNVENYLNNKSTEGLLTHEVHGFYNYMTKTIAGCDISDPNIVVTDEIFNKAVENLKKMKYVGFFEEYQKTIDDILTMFNLDVAYDCGPLKVSTIPETTKQLFTELNQYDIKLYDIAVKLKNEKPKNITYVTALLDIKRDELESKNFKREFQKYLDDLKKLLGGLGDENLVIYIEDKYHDYVKNIKPDKVIVKSISCDMIRDTEYYGKIQQIRQNPEWSGQAGWLQNSTQAKLELYNPLIFQKIHILDDVSITNPFDDEYFVWVDAGIANAQCNPNTFKEDWYKKKIFAELDKFLFINFPYTNFSEIHGFKKEGIKKYVGSDVEVNKVSRATYFGGKQPYIRFLTEKFRELAHKSLEDGYLGTEESIYTLLTYLHPSKINAGMTMGGGLVRGYFDALRNGNQEELITPKISGYRPEPYNGVRNQQNPKTFSVFTDFFKKHNDFDLIVDIGSGFGGLTLFLYEESQKMGSKFVSYESNENKCENIKNNVNKNIDIQNKDVFDVFVFNEIENKIKDSKKTLVLCDGGNLSREFNDFARVIKKGDIIMAHDYAPNKNIFQQKYKGKIWDWLEISDKDIQKSVDDFKLVDVHNDFNDVAWVCKKKTVDKKPEIPVPNKKTDFSKLKTNSYILTFNFPKQLLHTIGSMKKVPEWLENPHLVLIDNSTDKKAKVENQKIAEEYNMEYVPMDRNTGICGGRQKAAEHFHESDADYMFFFEDDMTINSKESEGQFCRNGFRKYIPNLYNLVHKIILKEDFDFLKFSFTEVYFDNDKALPWYNVPQNIRTRDWPDYDKLPVTGLDPNSPLAKYNHINVMDGVSYITGEINYANWPMIVSKTGNQKMFIDTKWAHPYEQTWSSHIYQLTKEGKIRSGLLLASPIWHDRILWYKPEERREN